MIGFVSNINKNNIEFTFRKDGELDIILKINKNSISKYQLNELSLGSLIEYDESLDNIELIEKQDLNKDNIKEFVNNHIKFLEK